MNKPPSKQQIRSEIERQMDDYLARGGEVVHVERGVSARFGADGPLPAAPRLFQEPRAERTPLNDVVARLEARRRPTPRPAPAQRSRKPRRKPLYDDFGEIIRWVWEE